MKEEGTAHWSSPNTGATNESGFTGLPAGFVNDGPSFGGMGYEGYFWCSDEYFSTSWGLYVGWFRGIFYNSVTILRPSTDSYTTQSNGFSIRCLADEVTTGCTDPDACNFNPVATVDDGSCYYIDCDVESTISSTALSSITTL